MSLYHLSTATLDETPVDLVGFAGTVTLVVNVASACGFTPQYKGLERLHEEFGPRGFAVLGFPSNEFGGQEPGTPAEIKTFCETSFGVTFPLFTKSVTQPGPGQSPVYAFLTRSGSVPNWNFCKYLVGRDGTVRGFFPSNVAPEDPALRRAIEDALAA